MENGDIVWDAPSGGIGLSTRKPKALAMKSSPVRFLRFAFSAILLAAAASAPAADFVRISSVDKLVPGDYVITGSKAGEAEYAMLNQTNSTPAILRQEEAVTVVDDTIANPDASIVWTLEEGDAGWTIYNADAGYVASKGANNAARFEAEVSTNSTWTFAEAGDGLFSVENVGVPGRFLMYSARQGSERFACYTGTQRPLAFYKKADAPVGDLKITSITIQRSGEGDTVTLEYTGDAATVQGTDNLETGKWTTVRGAVLDPETKTATVPMGQPFLRLSSASAANDGPEHAAVQLWEGGPYWAETNIGADQPEDFGLHFWWGDTGGCDWETTDGTNYYWVASGNATEHYVFSQENTETYGMELSTLLSEGWITEEGGLAPSHDAAQVYWGGAWRMPTDQDLQGLLDNCDWAWTETPDFASGYTVTGRGEFAANSIFLPAAGQANGEKLYFQYTVGYYWSGVPYDIKNFSYLLVMGISDQNGKDLFYGDRSIGASIRPVRDAAE